MNKDKPKSSRNTPTDTKDNKVGQLFPNASLEDYARQNNRVTGNRDNGEICDSKYDNDDTEDEVDDVEVDDDHEDDNNSGNEDCDHDDEDDNDENIRDQKNARKE